MTRQRIVILFGGPSVEREVSRISARTIAANLDPVKYEPIVIAVDSEGRFLPPDQSRRLLDGEIPAKFLEASGSQAANPDGAPRELIPLAIQEGQVDLVFPIIHGTTGEDGTLQGFLEILGIPFVGPGVLGSAVGMDKVVFKAVMLASGIPVTPHQVIRQADWAGQEAQVLRRVREKLDLPLFVKPANGGSSVGITKVHDPSELEAAIRTALRYDDKILVEEGIDGREIECSVLGNENPRASVPGEVIPGHEFYDYDDKYVDNLARFAIPADLPPAVTELIQRYAVEAFVASGCEGMARADFLVERGTNRIFLNEINTLPGFTAISMYPKLWEASGLPLPALLDELVQLGLQRAQRRREMIRRMIPPKELK
ncbi:MAG: D-alanine--D-alanine ligase [Bradymonadales bacterium]|nr:D-alanine--D-alanine ligase [Bradymonadales bacterium]